MKVFITGVAGFVGRHLTRELLAHGWDVSGFDQPGAHAPDDIRMVEGDLTDPGAMPRALAETRPDACVHLAGIAHVQKASEDCLRVWDINALGTVRLLEAVRAVVPACRTLVVSSTQVYGPQPDGTVVTEATPLRPHSPYGMTKAMADEAALYYARNGLPVLVARPANHTGPGQHRLFMAPSFAAQLAAIARGRAPGVLQVGNLECRRDFMDVRDMVRAYRLLLDRGETGRAYNIATGEVLKVGEVLDRMCDIAGVHPRRERDDALFRPTDAAPRIDWTRLAQATGWAPVIPLEKTLRDLYEEAFAAAG